MSDLQWSAVVIPLLLAFGGAVWWLFRERTSRTEQRLDEHIKEDTRAHERLTAVETKVENLQQEVRSLRDMRHEIITQCTQSISGFYTDAVKKISELREWIVERMK